MIEFIIQHAGAIGLVFFFTVFVSIIIWAFKPGSKQTIESYKFIPFSEEHNDLR